MRNRTNAPVRRIRRGHAFLGALLSLSAALALAVPAAAQSPASNPTRKEASVSLHASGTFDVKTTPLPPEEAAGGSAIGRYALDKQFHGDLEAAGKGEMLGAGDPAKGSAGYVAIEHVTGSLHGVAGSFALQHSGTMDGGKFQLTVSVVPGSGAGALAGITGSMTITIAAGKHSYTFDYSLPGPAAK